MNARPFKVWLEDHADDNTPLGDLARDALSDPNFPIVGGRRAVLTYLTKIGADAATFDVVEVACDLAGVEDGDDDETPAVHEFVVWLMQQGNPVFATFAIDFAELLPRTGSREALRAVVENDDREPDHTQHDPLAVFDVSWHQFRPTCESPGCTNAVGDQMDMCAVHTTLRELL